VTEWADVETSSADYATRFSGAVGEWFLERQARLTLELLAAFPGASVLEVGGGHAQLAGPLAAAGFEVTVQGSAASCRERLAPLVDAGRVRFHQAPLVPLPWPDARFDVVMAYRLLPHVDDWRALLAEMSRVARHAVVFDYPTRRSVNAVSGLLYGVKKGVEGNTRPFTVFGEGELRTALAAARLRPTGRRPEFLLPMALHRALGVAPLSRLAEALAGGLGLTRLLGSPVILRAAPTRDAA